MRKINFIILFLITLVHCNTALGQYSVKKFNDIYGLQGQILYLGNWSDTSLPSQGNYELKWRDLNENYIKTYSAKGNLKNALPQGKWTWEEGYWSYSIEPSNQLIPLFKSTGIQTSWKGNFADGLPNGKWIITVDSIISDKKTKPFITASIHYSNGKAVNYFTLEDKSVSKPFKLQGYCDAEGQATNTWIFDYPSEDSLLKLTEQRTYIKGILIEKQIIQNGKTIVQKTFDENKTLLQEIADSVNPYLTLSNAVFFTDQDSNYTSQLYQYYLDKYINAGWYQVEVKHNFIRERPIFRRFEYLLTPKERELQLYLADAIKNSKDTMEHYLKNTSLNINRGRNNQLDEALGYLQTIDLRLAVIDSLVLITQQDDYLYLNRSKLQLNAPIFESCTQIKGLYYPIELNLCLPIPNDTLTYLEQIHSIYTKSVEKLPFYLNVIDNNMEEIKREKELLAIEEQLYTKYNTLAEIYKNKTGCLFDIYEIWVLGNIGSDLKNYAQTTNYEASKIIAKKVHSKMDSLIHWVEIFEDLDTMTSAVKTQYTNFVYNPYNGKNDIEMLLKKRFYNVINQYLLPWMVENLHQIRDWEEFSEQLYICRKTYFNILTFVYKDDNAAKKTEKKIRKMTQPDKIQKTLNSYFDELKN